MGQVGAEEKGDEGEQVETMEKNGPRQQLYRSVNCKRG